jgi:hypothetical protein
MTVHAVRRPRKKKSNQMMHLLLVLLLPAQLDVALPADSVARLRSQARNAEAAFERVARNLAPVSWGGFDGRNCDEIVGRFCLRFDSTGSSRPPPGEAGRVVDARRAAVEALRRYYSVAPGERKAAGPLVRLLVLDDRAPEAVSAARTFAALSADTLWANLLLGLAQHSAGNAEAAERHFVEALARFDEKERRAWADPRWLVDYGEQRALRRMPEGARAEYERRFWIASDPLWLTRPNERWVEHMARHTEARLLSEVPLVRGMTRWGEDLDQLTVRYGTPSSRRRVPGTRLEDSGTFIEYFDTAQRAYAPERLLSAGFPELPLPGDPPPMYAARARSGVALRNVTRVIDLPHQATRFMAGGEIVLRVDGALPAPAPPAAAGEDAADAAHTGGGARLFDTDAARADRATNTDLQLGLFAYDSAFTRRVQSVRAVRWDGDTTIFSMSVRVRPGVIVYSVEALDTVNDFAARARYSLAALVPEEGPVVSDLLICYPFPDGRLPEQRNDPVLQARPDLRLGIGDTLGVYAEVYRVEGTGPESLGVEFSLEPADSPGLLTRLGRWVGRAAGLAAPQTDPRVAWRTEADGGIYPIALNLPLDPGRTGRHVLILRVTDRTTGQTTETRRTVLIRQQ